MSHSTSAARRMLGGMLLGVVLLVSLAAAACRASTAATPNAASAAFDEANKYYLEKNWPAASAALARVVKREPQNGRAWYRLGVSYQKLKNYDQAIESYRHAESISHNPAVMYNMACAFSLRGGADSAFACLGRAVDAGYSQPEALQADADLAPLHSDARFAEVVERVRRVATPCAFSPEARQFDFWVGSWDVRTPQGDLAGTNDIRLGAGECVLVENWKSTQGGRGQSLNFYDADAKLWRQIWVDATAEVTRFEGTFTEGQMRFKGERVSKTGQHIPVKMTFTPMPDGRVRQMGEISNDGGTSWSVEYDLYYSPARRQG